MSSCSLHYLFEHLQEWQARETQTEGDSQEHQTLLGANMSDEKLSQIAVLQKEVSAANK